MQNVNYAQSKLDSPDEERLWKAVLAPFEDIPDDIKKQIQEEQEKIEQREDSALKLVVALPPQQQADFWAGYSEGLLGPFTEKLGFTDSRDNTKIYHLLLMLGDLVRRFDTVEELYEFAKLRLKHEFPHSIETFRSICNSLGIRGAKYSASMRRKRSIEKMKPMVQVI